MTNADNHCDNLDEEAISEEIKAVAEQIYRAHLPPYLQDSCTKGRGKWYEDWLRERLDILVMSEICDDPGRLAELEELKDYVALLFGIFGASFRLLDHVGMHLRSQTFGQYELLPEDEALLRDLCQRFRQSKQPILNPFFPASL